MARAAPWRQTCPQTIRSIQQLAVLSPLFLLRQSGPAAYIVQESDAKPVQVRLGDPHYCSCKDHQKSRDLCLHICWVLLKKLQLKPFNALSYQLGLVPREMAALLEPPRQERRVSRKPSKAQAESQSSVPRRPVQPDDICPICLLSFRDSKLPVVHCRFSCGNAVHTRCMLQVARHQLDSQDVSSHRLLTCPLCRGPFCRGTELAEAAKRRVALPVARTRGLSPVSSHDVTCVFCRIHPVVGNLYRCLQCPQVLMCPQCVSCPEYAELHSNHGYAVKKDKWQPVRAANWTPSRPVKPRVPSKQVEDEVDTLVLRPCAYCGLGFQVSDVWAGQWKDFLLHKSCVEQLRGDQRACNPRMSGGLPLIDMTTLMGPPEVRVVRLSLTTRPQEPRAPPPELPRAPRPPRQHVSPLRVRPRRTKKKKKSQQIQTDADMDSKLPLSVTLGRALGAQVQPLMAILMSPRARTCSLDSDVSGEEEHSDEDEKTSSKAKVPLLSITSLELPELAPARNPQCQLVRRVRTSVRRTRQPAPCAVAAAQNIACAGHGLSARK
ncbi:uncharacterized protein LOC124360881 isoform X2 [Homalodisca vitripennis]|uniref:uncharacterized protein LOC124360881 isoform X2 n=1 Tax=Homalodisca vitripennis TaxID=197043 RepID=UPI001EEA6C6A|nr:uncharacterized protein LOC124360881 isoform X2 [Homalodisca vitripennis]